MIMIVFRLMWKRRRSSDHVREMSLWQQAVCRGLPLLQGGPDVRGGVSRGKGEGDVSLYFSKTCLALGLCALPQHRGRSQGQGAEACRGEERALWRRPQPHRWQERAPQAAGRALCGAFRYSFTCWWSVTRWRCKGSRFPVSAMYLVVVVHCHMKFRYKMQGKVLDSGFPQ